MKAEAAATGGEKSSRELDEEVRRLRRENERLRAGQGDAEKQRRVIESLSDAVLLIEGETSRVADANPSACSLYGYSVEELRGTPAEDLSQEPEETRSAMARALRAGSHRIPLQYHKTRDGRAFPCEIAASTIEWEGRTLICAVVHDISERISVEEELRRNEARLALAIEASGSGFYEYALDLSKGFISPLWAENLGFEIEEIPPVEEVFDWWASRIHPDDRERVLADHEDFVAGRKEIRRDEYRIRDKQGQWRHMRVSAIAVERDENGRALEVVGTEVDMTQRKEAELALRESEERYRSLYNSTPAMIHSIGPDGRIITVSDKWLEVMGYEREEVIGRHSLDFLTPASRRLAEELVFPAFLKRGSFSDVPYQFVRKDGSKLDVLLSGVLERGPDGKMKRATGVLRDITERKRAQQALRSSEQRYRELADLLPLSVFECTTNGTLTFLNKAGYQAFGFEPRDLEEGMSGFDLIAEKDRERARVNFGRRVSVELNGGDEYLLQRKDGSRFPALIQSTAVVQDNRVTGIRGIVIDITEQKEAEEERRRLQEQVLHAQKLESLGVLGGGIAHDFNNLLMGILGNANLALLETPSESPVRPHMEAIESTAQRAAELTKQLLAYSGKGKFVLKPLCLSQLVREMVHLLKISISKKAALHCQLAPDLPLVEADPAQMSQIVMNLITNASDALEKESGCIRVSTSLRRCSRRELASRWCSEQLPAGDYVCLEVSDSGSGMDRETLDKIFDPFFTTKFTGRGLGLAAVLGIVRAHHASIQVESRPGGGTTFRIFFPALEKREPEIEGSQERSAGVGRETNGRILVVDDEESIRDLAEMMLERGGYSVIKAANGSEALELYRENGHNVCLVLLDMTMPEMDGEQTFQRLREIDPAVRVVLSSGYNEDAASDLITQGWAGFLQKPYTTNDLIHTVSQALSDASP